MPSYSGYLRSYETQDDPNEEQKKIEEEKARKERELAFEEAKAESARIAETSSSPTQVTTHGVSLSEEQFEADFAELETAPTPSSSDYPDLITRREIVSEVSSPYTKVDTELDLQTLDTEEITIIVSDAPPPRAIKQVGEAVKIYEKPFALVERAISSTGIQLETETRLERTKVAEEEHLIRELEFDPNKTEVIFKDYSTLDDEPFTVETQPSSYVAPRISKGEDRPFVETQNLDFEDYLEVPSDVDAPIGVKMIGAAIIGAGYGAFRTVTIPLRPVAISETVLGTAELITDPSVLSDIENPLFGLGAIGGSVVGGYALGSAYSWLKGKYDYMKYGGDIPDEAFYLDDLTHDLAFPETVDVQRMNRYPEDVMVADELGSGFLSSKKYDPAGRSWPKSGTRGMGYRRTGEGLIQDLIPEGAGHLETWYKYRMEYGQAHLPGIRSTPAFNPLISVPRFGGTGAILGLVSGVESVHDKDLSITDVTPTLDEPIKRKPVGLLDKRLKGDTTQLFDIVNVNEMLTDLETFSDLDIGVGSVIRTDPILEDIEEPILDDIVIQDTTQDQEHKQDSILIQEPIKILDLPIPPSLFFQPTIPHEQARPRTPRKKQHVKEYDPFDPLGWEMKEYPESDMATLLGISFKPVKKKKRKSSKKKSKKKKKKPSKQGKKN